MEDFGSPELSKRKAALEKAKASKEEYMLVMLAMLNPKMKTSEYTRIGILRAEDVEDSHVVHVPKTYPAYFGSYDRFDVIRKYTDSFENLFLVGRNGMHKYNNQDHSMLTAMTAVENIVNGITTKENIWAINTEMEYHEEKASH